MGVPWCKNEDEAKIDGETTNGVVVMMDTDYKEKLEREEHIPVPKREKITRENSDKFGFTARCPGCMSLHRGTGGQAHREKYRRRLDMEIKETAKTEAARARKIKWTGRLREKCNE